MRTATWIGRMALIAVAAACGDGSDVVLGKDGADGGYDPCASKKCGDQCFLCPPNDPNCVETGAVKWCDTSGKCLAGQQPVCASERSSSNRET